MPSRIGRKLGRFDKKFGVLKKVKKYGPKIGAAALALGTIAAGAYVSRQTPSQGMQQRYPERPQHHVIPQDVRQIMEAHKQEQAMAKESFFQMQEPLAWREGQVIHVGRGRAGIDD